MKGCRTLGQVHSHLSEEERQIIQIEIDNGTSIRRIAGLIGRHASTVSREIVLLQCLLGGFGSVFLNIQLNTYTRRRHHGPDRTQHHLAGNRRIQHVRTRARPVAAPKKRTGTAPAASNVKHAGAGPQ
ncbi:MAG: helix-turn-helix domain-containing protein [Varibaculum sp.]